MKNQRDDTGVRYFFTGEFRKYKKMFERHCPPPMKVPKGIWDMLAQSVSDLESEVRGLANSIEMMGSEGDN